VRAGDILSDLLRIKSAEKENRNLGEQRSRRLWVDLAQRCLSMGETRQPLKFQAFQHSWLCSPDEKCPPCLAYTPYLAEELEK
jgi:hypothetical protein